MVASNSPSESTFRLADRLAMARRRRFVGREAEVELFRSALLAAEAEPSFAVLHLYGPGGIGKTTLLREYARIATETGCSIALLDRNLDPSPSGFLLALRQALRDYTRPDLLAINPLMRSRLVVELAEPGTSPASLTGNPKDEKLYRAIYHTYLEPAPGQERAAELLDLPFTTYRYHLAGGLKHITEWLWQRELHDFEP